MLIQPRGWCSVDDDDDFAEGDAHASDVEEVDEVENSDDDLEEAPARRATGQLKVSKPPPGRQP